MRPRVNQNQTRREELVGEFMVAEAERERRAQSVLREYARRVAGRRHLLLLGHAHSGPRHRYRARRDGSEADFGRVGTNWARRWYVPVEYLSLDNRIRPKDHIVHRSSRASIRRCSSMVTVCNPSTLRKFPQPLADALMSVIGQAYYDAYAALAASLNTPRYRRRRRSVH